MCQLSDIAVGDMSSSKYTASRDSPVIKLITQQFM